MLRIKLNRNFLIILLATALVLVVSILIYQRYQYQQHFLINYLPRGSWYYWQINLGQVDLVEELRQDLALKRQLEDWLLMEGLPVNVWRGDYRIGQLALVKAEIDYRGEKRLVEGWLVYSPDDIYSLVATELENYYCKFLNQHVALLTKSEELIRFYQPTKADLDRFWLDKLMDEDKTVAGGFVKLEKYFGNLFKGNEESVWQDYLSGEGRLNWLAQAKDRGFQIRVDLPVKASLLGGLYAVNSRQISSIKILPEGVGVWFDFRPQVIIESLNSELANYWKVDPIKLKSFIEAKYQVDFNSLYTFFEQPYYVIFRARNQPQSLTGLFNISNYEYAIIGEQEIDERALFVLKQMSSAYVAFKYPIKKKKTLPDGSQGWELVAESSSWPWREQEIAGGELGVLKTPRYELSYFNYQGGFMLSNSEKLIKDILLSGQTVDLTERDEKEVWIESSFWRSWGLGTGYEVEIKSKYNLNKLQLDVFLKK